MSLGEQSPYAGYLYSYPHKTAYRTLLPSVPLGPLWAAQDRSALSLYVHVPFCEMRCGFCNLFTRSRPPDERVTAWLRALDREARIVDDLVGERVIDRFAIGGGTPTMLSAGQLSTVLDIVGRFGALGRPSSVETSPATATPDRLSVLKAAGVTRISMGVQSFESAEVQTAQRPQTNVQVTAALTAIRDAGFPVLNLDLIYGIPGQTVESWQRSIGTALDWSPEELYLYPLYIRPLTGMASRARTADDAHRLELYRAGRDLLLGQGYEQCSMRMFRRLGVPTAGGAYRCQEDGMIGLGVGARSYTSKLHYATDFAVGARGVEGIIDAWIARTDEERTHARHGIWLDEAEQSRRRLILTLLGREPVVSIPGDLEESVAGLTQEGLAAWAESGLTLTAEGIARSDAIGPALISPPVRQRMQAWELR